jgi:hypothetical protein
VSRLICLAYLSPTVVERIVVRREAIASSLDQLAAASFEPWARQPGLLFE